MQDVFTSHTSGPSGGPEVLPQLLIAAVKPQLCQLSLGKNVNPNTFSRPGRVRETDGPLWGLPGEFP